MKKQILRYYLLFLVCISCLHLPAQEYIIQRLTVTDGLPSDRVYCAYEDSYGYLWVGTSNGLGRYDGRRFTNYGFSDGLPYLQISCIFEDSRQRLWVGTTKGIAQLAGEKFIAHKTNDAGAFTDTYGFYETTEKEIWALTNKGIYRFDDTIWTHIDPYPLYKGITCRQIISLPSGLLFNYGISLVKKNNNGRWSVMASANPEYFNELQVQAGKTYVSAGDKLYSIENEGLNLVLDSIPATGNYNYYVDDGKCFVSIEGQGLYVYDLSEKNPKHFFFTAYRSNFLFHIYCDTHGNLWMMSYEGLLKIQPKTFTDYQKEVFQVPLKEIRNIVSLYNDLLISSSHSGLHILHDNDKTLESLPTPSFYASDYQYRHDMIEGYTDDAFKGTWMMTKAPKLIYINQGKITDYTKNIKRRTNEPFYDIAENPVTRKIYVCADSTLWVGDKDKMEIYRDADGKSFDRPISVAFTYGGVGIVNVFFKGIYFITKENKIIKAPPELDIIDERVSGWIYPGTYNWMWVRNSGRGLLCFRVNDSCIVKNVQQYTTAEGMPSNDVLDISTDKEGRLWAITSNGIGAMVYNKEKDSWDIYNAGKQQGINFDSWVSGRMAMNTLGHIWFSTTDNLFKVYPEKIHLRKEVPRAVIEKIMLGMKETDWKQHADSVYSYFQLPYKPVFRYNENSFGIQFNGTNLTESSVQEFSYMLSPLDTTWSQPTKNNFVSLLKLLPGNYIFKVRVRNEDTGWSEPASFSFSIERPFWDRWWFRLLLIGLAAFIIIYVYSRRIKAIREEAFIQSQLNELEMKALKAQMNPHFIYNALNSIQSLIVDEKKSEAINYVGTFSRLLRQVLEHTDSNVVTLEKELQTLRLYIQLESLRLNINLKYNLSTADDVMTEYEKVPPLILQPFVENALWHGLSRKEGEKNLKICVSQNEEYLICTIEDNGIGRTKAATFKKSSATEMYASRGIDITVRRLTEFNKTKDSPVLYKDLFDSNGEAAGTRVDVYIKKQSS